jgi:hypothetical protein
LSVSITDKYKKKEKKWEWTNVDIMWLYAGEVKGIIFFL